MCYNILDLDTSPILFIDKNFIFHIRRNYNGKEVLLSLLRG